jgi:hypothetical protein
MALLLLFVGIKLFSGARGASPAQGRGQYAHARGDEGAGHRGDTPRDTVATLVAQVKQLRTELQTRSTTTRSRRPRTSACARESAIDQRIQSALEGERGRLQQDREQVASDRQQTQGLLQDLQRRLDGFPARAARPICRSGWGWRTATASASTAASVARSGSSPTMRSRRQERQGPSFPRASGRRRRRLSAAVEAVADAAAAPWARPRSRSTPCRRTRR